MKELLPNLNLPYHSKEVWTTLIKYLNNTYLLLSQSKFLSIKWCLDFINLLQVIVNSQE